MSFDPGLERAPLTAEERRQLTQAEFRAGSVSLAGRHVADLVLEGPTWADSWEQLWAERTTFRRCLFHGHDFSALMMKGATFEDCTFESCRYHGAHFVNCRFARCVFRGGRARGATFQQASFSDCTFEAMTFYGLCFDGVSVQRGRLAGLRFSAGAFSRLEIQDAALDGVRLTLCQVGYLLLARSRITQLVLLGGEFGTLEVREGALDNSSLAETRVRALCMSSVEGGPSFRMNGTRVDALRLTDCHMSDLYAAGCVLGTMEIAGGTCRGWITACRIGPGSRVEDAELVASFWDDTEAEGLVFSRVAFTRFISVRGVRFSGMTLEGVRYAPGFEVEAEGARFERSDSFAPAPRPGEAS